MAEFQPLDGKVAIAQVDMVRSIFQRWKKWMILWLSGIMIVLVFSPGVAMGLYNPGTEQFVCIPLDIVFVIDQSSSMINNDSTYQREYAPKAMIDLLVGLLQTQCTGTDFRISVVYFGTKARTVLPLTSLRPYVVDGEVRTSALENDLKQYLAWEDMQQTDPQAGFKNAATELNTSQSGHKQAIIFLTDGRPCVSREGCSRDSSVMNVQNYMQELSQQIQADFYFDKSLLDYEACLWDLFDFYGARSKIPASQFMKCKSLYPVADQAYENSTYIWVLLLDYNDAINASLERQYEAIARQYAGRKVSLGADAKQIPDELQKILERLIGFESQPLTCNQAFAVNPYLKTAVIRVYKSDPALPVNFSYKTEASQPFVAPPPEVSSLGEPTIQTTSTITNPNQVFIFPNPEPGLWKLEATNCEAIRAYYEPVAVKYLSNQNVPMNGLIQHSALPFYDPLVPVFLEYQLLDDSGKAIKPAKHPRLALHVEAVVTDPQGNYRIYPLEWQSDAQIFRAVDPLQMMFAGVYTYTISGSYFKHVGEPNDFYGDDFEQIFSTQDMLFRQANLNFVVSPENVPRQFYLQILSPLPETFTETVAIDTGQIYIPIRVQILDQKHQPVDASQIFENPDQAIVAWATAPDYESETITLTRGDLPGYFVGLLNLPTTSSPVRLVTEVQGVLKPGLQIDQLRKESEFDHRLQVLEGWNIAFLPVWVYLLIGFLFLIMVGNFVLALRFWLRYDRLVHTKPAGYVTLYNGDVPTSLGCTVFDGTNEIPRRDLRKNDVFDLRWLKVEYTRVGPTMLSVSYQTIKGKKEPPSFAIIPKEDYPLNECIMPAMSIRFTPVSQNEVGIPE